MLEQSHFLLQILRVISQVVSLHHILLLSLRDSFPLIVVESVAVRVNDDLSGIIEEDSSCLI
jgi:hypothetical protein